MDGFHVFMSPVDQVYVNDTNNVSNSVQVNIAIRLVNDEPPNVVPGVSEVMFVEELGPVLIVGENASINDLDYSTEHQVVTAVCTQILNRYPEDQLLSNSSYAYIDNENSLCLDLKNCSSQSCYKALLSSLYYNNTADEPVLVMRIIQLMVSTLHDISKMVAFPC